MESLSDLAHGYEHLSSTLSLCFVFVLIELCVLLKWPIVKPSFLTHVAFFTSYPVFSLFSQSTFINSSKVRETLPPLRNHA